MTDSYQKQNPAKCLGEKRTLSYESLQPGALGMQYGLEQNSSIYETRIFPRLFQPRESLPSTNQRFINQTNQTIKQRGVSQNQDLSQRKQTLNYESELMHGKLPGARVVPVRSALLTTEGME